MTSAASLNRRRILSLWLPRLPTDRIKRLSAPGGAPAETRSVESRPTIVIAKQGNTVLIAALDEAAARLGLETGTPLANARAVCPDIQVFDADEPADAKLLNDIADWCDRFTPLVALDQSHGLFLDITGCAHLFGGEAALMKALAAPLTRQGFAVRAAIAGTPACARALTRVSHGQIVAEGQEARAVHALPVSALEAGEAVTRALRRAGLKTIGEVAARDRREITSRFGANFTALLEQVLGQGDAPISPRRPLPDFVAEKRFAEPVATADIIQATLSSLTGILIAAMERQGKGARQLAASFFRVDGMVRTIVVEAGQAITQKKTAARLFSEKIDALNDPIDPGFGFDLIRLHTTCAVDVAPSQRGFDSHAHDAAEVSELADRLAVRLGPRRVVRYMPQDTHIPERSAMGVPLLYWPPEADDPRWPQRIKAEPPLRPLRLLQHPEHIDVIALFPDGPPAQFDWRRLRHRIVHVEGPERIAMEWWHSEVVSENDLTRDYFRVENEDGRRFWIYRRGIYMREVAGFDWFLHGVFA